MLLQTRLPSRRHSVTHEVSTVQVCCLRTIFLSVTHWAAGSGCPQYHGTSCRLCRCAASGASSVLSLTGPRGRAAHSITARAVDCAGVLPLARLPFCHSLGRGVGPPTVSRHEVSTVQVCCLQPLPLFPTRPGRCHRHADSDTNIRSGSSVRQPQVAPGPGCTPLLVH